VISLLAVQIGMHPRTLDALVPLSRFVRSRPIASGGIGVVRKIDGDQMLLHAVQPERDLS
jgi:hypothetical protein